MGGRSAFCRRTNPTVVADLSMPPLNGVEAVRQILQDHPKSKIVFLTMHTEAIYAIEAMRAGARGYVLKNEAGEELIGAIRRVLDGQIYVTPSLAGPVTAALQARRKMSRKASGKLTPRQREVLQLLAEGHMPKEIGAKLNMSTRTVEFHKYRMMETLGIRTVDELAVYAAKQGIVP